LQKVFQHLSKEQIVQALAQSNNNSDQAVDYLLALPVPVLPEKPSINTVSEDTQSVISQTTARINDLSAQKLAADQEVVKLGNALVEEDNEANKIEKDIGTLKTKLYEWFWVGGNEQSLQYESRW